MCMESRPKAGGSTQPSVVVKITIMTLFVLCFLSQSSGYKTVEVDMNVKNLSTGKFAETRKILLFKIQFPTDLIFANWTGKEILC
jgi:hypothetical protein